MNMVATKPRRYVGRHERMGAPRAPPANGWPPGCACKRATAARGRRAPPRLPRTPEQAAAAAAARRSAVARER